MLNRARSQGDRAGTETDPKRDCVKRTLILILKFVVMVAILGFVFFKLRHAWENVGSYSVHLDWRFLLLIPLCFLGIMTTNALTWLWLARRMGDRSNTVPLLGAYVYSQLGKYAPGKVFLVIIRLGRTHRAGMTREVCLLSTLLENAMYTLSGGLVGALTLLVAARDHPFYIACCLVLITLLLCFFHPRIFFPVINLALKSMKRGPIPLNRRFALRDMIGAVIRFMPCWIFGGIALWASVRALHPIAFLEIVKLTGVFALSVSLGMFSLLPSGLGVRDGVQMLFLGPLLGIPQLVVVAVAILRVVQIIVELSLAGIGGIVNSRTTLPSEPRPQTAESPVPQPPAHPTH